MTDNIKSIFGHNIRICKETDKAVFYFRQQQYDKALSIVTDFIDEMKIVIEAIITDRNYFNLAATESVIEMLSGILEAMKNKDFILLADLLELQLLSFLCGVQELIVSREEILFEEEHYTENIQLLSQRCEGAAKQLLEPIKPSELMESGYRVEFTSSGLMTLAAQNEGASFYFHTNSRIQNEAFLLAKHWLSNEKKKYILYGFGMGYHIRQLQELAPEAELYVYEADGNVIQLACAFTDLKELITQEHTHIIFDPDMELIKERIQHLTEEEAFLIHYPSFMNIRKKELKQMMETFIPWSGAMEIC
ncbi:MAG: hypothetical protein K0S76_43 [Herbinix sp.]|nr:hypothetical protein [Herbinix sp.]